MTNERKESQTVRFKEDAPGPTWGLPNPEYAEKIKLRMQREPGDWVCYLFGGDDHGLSWRPIKDQQPNAFHRFMQGLILGHRWVYRPFNRGRP